MKSQESLFDSDNGETSKKNQALWHARNVAEINYIEGRLARDPDVRLLWFGSGKANHHPESRWVFRVAFKVTEEAGKITENNY